MGPPVPVLLGVVPVLTVSLTSAGSSGVYSHLVQTTTVVCGEVKITELLPESTSPIRLLSFKISGDLLE